MACIKTWNFSFVVIINFNVWEESQSPIAKYFHHLGLREARVLIKGVYFHIFMFWPTNFFNPPYLKKSSWAEFDYVNIHTPINALGSFAPI